MKPARTLLGRGIVSPISSPTSKGRAKRYGLKLFFFGFLFSSLLAPAFTFGLTWLGYVLTGVESLRSLESLALLDAERTTVFAFAVLAVSLLLFLVAFFIGRAMKRPDSTAKRAAPLVLLLLSLPLLLLADQALYLHVLDNPFAAARHMLMVQEGWGAVLIFWQALFVLAFLAGTPKSGRGVLGTTEK